MPGKPKVTTQKGSWAALAQQALPIRYTVFVHEQAVPLEIEVDQWDEEALHVVLLDATGVGLATGRLVIEAQACGVAADQTGQIKQIGRIGRVAVLAPCRGLGLGAQVMTTLIEAADQQGLQTLTLHARQSASAFYERFGFRAVGEAFEEAGSPHIEMWCHTVLGPGRIGQSGNHLASSPYTQAIKTKSR